MNASTNRDDEWLTGHELAERWKTTPKALGVERCTGGGPRYFKLGGRVRYRLADVLEYEARGMREPGQRASEKVDNDHYVNPAPVAAVAEG